jgi:hypothetical protein
MNKPKLAGGPSPGLILNLEQVKASALADTPLQERVADRAPQATTYEEIAHHIKQFCAECLANRAATAVQLRNAHFRVEVNRMIFEVPYPIDKNRLEEVRDELVGWLKTRLQNPTLQMSVVVNADLIPPETEQRYLNRDELQERMLAKNPDLGLLIKEFGAAFQ